MDKFRKLIDNGFVGFTTSGARSIIKDSAEVTQYIDSKREHFNYVQQLMNDKIIDEAMTRARSKGEFEYDGEGGFTYKQDSFRYGSSQLINEQYPYHQPVKTNIQQYPQSDSIISRLDAMEKEISSLREENKQLRSKYGILK